MSSAKPYIRLSCPQRIFQDIELPIRNLAILLNSDIEVFPTELDQIQLHYDNIVALPIPHLEAWQNTTPSISEWRQIQLPQIVPPNDLEYPDLLGLLYYLCNDLEERRQPARFNIDTSLFAKIYNQNYLDKVIAELKRDLGVRASPSRGIILTHDIDMLSAQFMPKRQYSYQKLLFCLKNLRFRESIQALGELGLSFVKNPRGDNFEHFEFLDWASLEKRFGYKSIFFVFAHDRRKTSLADAWYDWAYVDPREPSQTLGNSLRVLQRDGYCIGLHLSRSSNYEHAEIEREFRSVVTEINSPVQATRNHWLWIEYSNWYTYLKQLEVLYDFNVAAIGYPKGSTYPYFNSNHSTMTFPTTYADDLVLKRHNLDLDEVNAQHLFVEQILTLSKYGGCTAISFHPAEDPKGSLRIPCKLAFYEKILEIIRDHNIPVLTPEVARLTFERKVWFSSQR